jgi:hypothetical protein
VQEGAWEERLHECPAIDRCQPSRCAGCSKPKRDGELHLWGVAGDVFGEEQAARTSHRRRASSHLRSHGSVPIARYLDSTAECRRAFGGVLRPLASGHRCHRCHHFWQGSGPIVVGIHVRLLVCLWREPRRVALYILVTEVTAVMKTIICSETLRLPTGPQPEDARFPRQGVGTDREGCPVDIQGRP